MKRRVKTNFARGQNASSAKKAWRKSAIIAATAAQQPLAESDSFFN